MLDTMWWWQETEAESPASMCGNLERGRKVDDLALRVKKVWYCVNFGL